MRPLPLVVSGASGGLVGLGLQGLREFSSPALVPPDPDRLGSALATSWEALDFQPPAFFHDVHWPSLLLGLACGLLAWPCLDFLLIIRRGLFRAARKAARPFMPGELYRLIE